MLTAQIWICSTSPIGLASKTSDHRVHREHKVPSRDKFLCAPPCSQWLTKIEKTLRAPKLLPGVAPGCLDNG